jgi:hypothetical protein
VIEARFLANKGSNVWHTYNINEVNVIENGFADEFKRAQQNLAINQAAGVASFANRGLPGQVPLPLFDAMFGARGSQPALPAGQAYTNGTFINNLNLGEAGRLAQSLASNVIYACRLYGNNFGPCAARGFDAAGHAADQLLVPQPVRHRRQRQPGRRQLVHPLQGAADATAAALRRRGHVHSELHAGQEYRGPVGRQRHAVVQLLDAARSGAQHRAVALRRAPRAAGLRHLRSAVRQGSPLRQSATPSSTASSAAGRSARCSPRSPAIRSASRADGRR